MDFEGEMYDSPDGLPEVIEVTCRGHRSAHERRTVRRFLAELAERTDDTGMLRFAWAIDSRFGEPVQGRASSSTPIVYLGPRTVDDHGKVRPGQYVPAHINLRCGECGANLPMSWSDMTEVLDKFRSAGKDEIDLALLVYTRTT